MPRTDNNKTTTSTADINEHRRQSNKPVMEKKRRARINNCLNELKSLLMEAMRKDPTIHSKLEKADILEMTVKHLQDMQSMRRQLAVMAAAASSIDSATAVVAKYRAGFNECATEVARYVARAGNDFIGPGAKRRLLAHLANSMDGALRTSSTNMSASTTISAMAAARSTLMSSRRANGDTMEEAAALLLPSGARSLMHVDWTSRPNVRTSSLTFRNDIAASLRVAHGDNARPTLPASSSSSSSSVNCCSVSPMSDEDRGFATNSGTEVDKSSCSSCNSDRELAEDCIVCIDDDDDDGYVDRDQNSDSGEPINQRNTRGDQPEPAMPVNLSKDIDKMWRPW